MGVPTPSAAADTDLQLLAIGDVHLGTRPSRLGDVLADAGIESSRLTPEAALAATVELALERRVDAVLFAGDVVESTNARFEALRPLESAVQRLAAAGIPVLGVVGNHDVEALPRLAQRIEGFELLGESGRWSSRRVESPGGAAAEIVGWSFPERVVSTSPFAQLADDLPAPSAAAGSSGVRLGLLHGDLDARGGTYAPFSSREVQQSGLDALLLGHIHKPSLVDGPLAHGATACGYLGSLVGLDPNETGPHGPWLVRISGASRISLEQVPLAPLRWEHRDVGVDEGDGPDDVGDRLLDEMERAAREIADAPHGRVPEVLGLRIRLVGETRHYEALRSWVGELAARSREPLKRTVGRTFVFVDRVHDGLGPAVDLAAMSRGTDPAALLARKLLELEHPGEARQRLLEQARERLAPIARDGTWSPAGEIRDARDPLEDDLLIALLVQSGRTALQALLDQRPASAAHGASAPSSRSDERAAE